MKTLFIPSENYFINKFSEIQSKIAGQFAYDITFLQTLQSVGPRQINNIEVDIMGVHATVIRFDFLSQAVDSIRPFIQAWLYFLLLLYHVNNVFKLLRGTPLFEMTGHSILQIGGQGQNLLTGGDK